MSALISNNQIFEGDHQIGAWTLRGSCSSAGRPLIRSWFDPRFIRYIEVSKLLLKAEVCACENELETPPYEPALSGRKASRFAVSK